MQSLFSTLDFSGRGFFASSVLCIQFSLLYMSASKILWIDDQIDSLRPFIILLEKQYVVKTATSGLEGIELFKTETFDLIFLDHNMIGMSGLETLAELKFINPAVPVVMVTQEEDEDVLRSAYGHRVDDYIVKPIRAIQITSTCTKFLGSKALVMRQLNESYIRDYTDLSRKILMEPDWNEWVEIYEKLVAWNIEFDKHTGSGSEETMVALWKDANKGFSKFVEREYKHWAQAPEGTDRSPVLSPKVMEKFVFPLLADKKPVYVFILDCLRLDQWIVIENIIRPLFDTIKRDTYLSIIPTATPYARNAIFAGLFPADIQKHYPQWWVDGSGEDTSQNRFEKELLMKLIERKRLPVQRVGYEKIHDKDYGEKIANKIVDFRSNQITTVVINFLDMIAHSRSDYAILKTIAPDESAYRSLTESWFKHSSFYTMLQKLAQTDSHIIVTTDHGAIRCLHGTIVRGNRDTSTCLRFKFGQNVQANERNVAMHIDKLDDYKLPKGSVTTNYVVAKEDYYFVYPTNQNDYLNKYLDSFQHGGISLEEMIVPVITMTTKKN